MKDLLAELDLEAIPRISLGTAVLVIFIACAAFALLRGLARLALSSANLALALGAAWLTWSRAPLSVLHPWPSAPPWTAALAPLLAGFLTLLGIRRLLRWLFLPSPESSSAPKKRRPLVLALCSLPATALCLAGTLILRPIGSLAEIHQALRGSETPAATGLLAAWKKALDQTLPSALLDRIDPLHDEARVNLAKWIATATESPPPKAIPVLEEPELRALILEDPRVRELARRQRYAEILRDPRLDHVMADPDLREILRRSPP